MHKRVSLIHSPQLGIKDAWVTRKNYVFKFHCCVINYLLQHQSWFLHDLLVQRLLDARIRRLLKRLLLCLLCQSLSTLATALINQVITGSHFLFLLFVWSEFAQLDKVYSVEGTFGW